MMMKIGCGFTCQNPDVVFLRPSTILNRRNPAAGGRQRNEDADSTTRRRDEKCQDAKLPRHTSTTSPTPLA